MAKPKKKSQGFGKSQHRTRSTRDFIVAFGKKKERAEQEVFLTANLEKLDESLLETLPLVFQAMTKGGPLSTREAVATIFLNFGVLLWQFPRGLRWLNLELSITAYELALRIFTHEDSPGNWAVVQANLGTAYCVRIRGKLAENLEKAIAFHESALEIFTREDFPPDWADVQMNLGNTYRERIRGDRAENVEKAIAFHESALEIFTREDFLEKWAKIQGNLGLVYSDRIQGDKAKNIEQAITAFGLSLEIFTQESFPENWARNQHNLADAYLNRVKGNPKENIEEAISLYNEAAEVFTYNAYPYKWFRNHAHLGVAYLERANLHLTETDVEPDRLTDLNVAVSLLQEALATADPSAPTLDYIDAQFQLGTALKQRHALTKDTADLEQSLKAYKIAYDAISPEHYERDKMWQALPEIQTILGSRLVRDGEWLQGLELLKAAISQLSPRSRTNPLAYANALYQIGRTHEIMSNWKDARIYYRDALRFYEHIDNNVGMARCHHGLGAILGCQGALVESIAELEQAHDLYQHQGLNDEIEEMDELIALAKEGQKTNIALNLRISA